MMSTNSNIKEAKPSFLKPEDMTRRLMPGDGSVLAMQHVGKQIGDQNIRLGFIMDVLRRFFGERLNQIA
jgi:hypothetical protein